jgi:hypothetical protein
MSNDYTRQIEHIGAGMTPDDRQLAIINGIQNNLGSIIHMMQQMDQRILVLERTVTYLEEKSND